jgi:Photosynthetic reaction centre cytochrome C subunit
MRRHAIVVAALVLFASPATPQQSQQPKLSDEAMDVLASIKGKEKLPASQVFKNIKVLGDMPAGRLVSVMDLGYSRALGVNCTYCHVDGAFEADDIRAKRAAREMILFTRRINDELAKMPEIDNEEPTVNCTTCHRGYVKPALQMR